MREIESLLCFHLAVLALAALKRGCIARGWYRLVFEQLGLFSRLLDYLRLPPCIRIG